MTALLERAVDALRRMGPEQQDGMAQAILTLVEDRSSLAIEPEHLPYVLEGLAQIERGEFASEAEIVEAFRSFDR